MLAIILLLALIILSLATALVVIVALRRRSAKREPFAVDAVYLPAREQRVLLGVGAEHLAPHLPPTARVVPGEAPSVDVALGEVHSLMRALPAAARANMSVQRVWVGDDGVALVLTAPTPKGLGGGLMRTDLNAPARVAAPDAFSFELLRAVVMPNAIRDDSASTALRVRVLPMRGDAFLPSGVSVVDYSAAKEADAGRLAFHAPLAAWHQADTGGWVTGSQDATRVIALPVIFAAKGGRASGGPEEAKMTMYFIRARPPVSAPPGFRVLREVRTVYQRVRTPPLASPRLNKAGARTRDGRWYVVEASATHAVLESAWLLPGLAALRAQELRMPESVMMLGRRTRRVRFPRTVVAFPPELRDGDRVLLQEGDGVPGVVVASSVDGFYEALLYDDRANDANEYICYDDPVKVRAAECPGDSWDKACEANDECPYFQVESGRGGCVAGHCEMPLGVRRVGFRKGVGTALRHRDGQPAFADDHVARFAEGAGPLWHSALVE